jgi:hypothetical protein
MISPNLTLLASRLTATVSPLTITQTRATPPTRPCCWSIQQITEHLLLTYQVTCTNFETRIAKATPTKATPTVPQRLGQLALLNIGYFPRSRKAPPMVCPGILTAAPLSGPDLAAQLNETLTRMDTLIAQAETLFGPRTRAISHQVLGPLTSRQWTRFHLVHGLHHLAQIEHILKP